MANLEEDKMEDTVLTKAENDMIKSAFRSMDLNGDGKVSVSELCRACKQINLKLRYEEAKTVLQEKDLNGDGYLDFDEFHDMMKDQINVKRTEEKYLRQIFNKMDDNNDNYITVDEIMEFMNISKEEADELLNEADKNKDGRINFQEFVEA